MKIRTMNYEYDFVAEPDTSMYNSFVLLCTFRPRNDIHMSHVEVRTSPKTDFGAALMDLKQQIEGYGG